MIFVHFLQALQRLSSIIFIFIQVTASQGFAATTQLNTKINSQIFEHSQDIEPILRGGYHRIGRHLYDPCGEKLILRGVNEMFVYLKSQDYQFPMFEIAKSGANAVRIQWTVAAKNPSGLAKVIQAALDAQMLPIPELHDATGKIEKLPLLIDYWTSPEILAIIHRFQDKILLNVGNEVGDDKVSSELWERAWTEAIQRLRAAKITAPLIIDAAQWGQDIDQLQSSGHKLLEMDPLKNLFFSVHMWWADGDAAKIARELGESISMGLPLIVGEFGPYAVYQCPSYAFDYSALMSLSAEHEISWLAWSWGAVKNRDCPGLFDMTKDGSFASLHAWGLEVALTHPYSIRNSAKRTHFIEQGYCR